MAKSDSYDSQVRALQIGLVNYQLWARQTGAKALVIIEGRDTAGKDGTITRITEHLAPRNTRIVALPKPSDRERSQWYFQRYIEHLPAAGEFVIFNRSWYNRAGVEPVMGFCTAQEHEDFLEDVPALETMIQETQMRLIKVWLDISKTEQAQRLKSRQDDPLKRLKVSELDAVAQSRWQAYSAARDQMLLRTHNLQAPWVCVRADDKKLARVNVMRHLLQVLAPPKVRGGEQRPDSDILFPFEPAALTDGRLAR